MQALVETLIFLELSEDDTLDPDAAVKAMEAVAYYLQRISDKDKPAFISTIFDIAESQPATAEGLRRKEFIKSIPEYFGIRS